MIDLVLDLLKKQGERLHTIEDLLSDTKTVLNMDDVANLTGLSKSHLYKLTSAGKIPHYKQSKHVYFDRYEIEAWLKENRIKTALEIEHDASRYVTLNKRGGAL